MQQRVRAALTFIAGAIAGATLLWLLRPPPESSIASNSQKLTIWSPECRGPARDGWASLPHPPRFMPEPVPALGESASKGADDAAPRAKTAIECATSHSDDCPFLETSPEALKEMARCGVVRVDMPLLDADLYDVPESERAAVTAAVAEFSKHVKTQLESLQRLLKIEHPVPAEHVRAAMEAVEALLDPQESERALRTIAAERAGLKAPSMPGADTSPAETYWRFKASLGDDFEHNLGTALGPERAHALRRSTDGWAGKYVVEGQCRDG